MRCYDKRENVGRAMGRVAAVAAFLLSAAACDGDPAGPRPGPDPELRLKRTVSYFADRPQDWQAGDYFYDAQGRLERYEHTSTSTGEPQTTIRKEYLYQPDGRPLGHDGFVNLAGEWYHTRRVRYSYQAGSQGPFELRLEDIDEATGQVVPDVWGLVYDARGQLIEIRKEEATETFTYDDNGDVIRIRIADHRFGVFEDRLTYTNAWNPLAGLPPLHSAFGGIIFPGEFSRHLSANVESGPEGQPPSTRATATVVTNSLGYPTRWEVTFWSTSEPENNVTAITEYEYYGR